MNVCVGRTPLFTASEWPRSLPGEILTLCTGAVAGVGTRATMMVVLDEEETGAGSEGGVSDAQKIQEQNIT